MVDGHVHKAPHSGVIAHVGPYHIELVARDATIEVWLLDQNERLVLPPENSRVFLKMNRPIKGPIRFKVGGELLPAPAGADEVLLVPVGERYESAFDLERVITTGFKARAELRLATRTLPTEFEWTPLDARHRLDDRKSPTKQ